MVADVLTVVLVVVGLGFFTAGTVGLLRFPDLSCRLHAMTKADTLGLGFVLLGLAFQVDGVWSAAKLFVIWLFALTAAAITATLLASEDGEHT